MWLRDWLMTLRNTGVTVLRRQPRHEQFYGADLQFHSCAKRDSLTDCTTCNRSLPCCHQNVHSSYHSQMSHVHTLVLRDCVSGPIGDLQFWEILKTENITAYHFWQLSLLLPIIIIAESLLLKAVITADSSHFWQQSLLLTVVVIADRNHYCWQLSLLLTVVIIAHSSHPDVFI